MVSNHTQVIVLSIECDHIQENQVHEWLIKDGDMYTSGQISSMMYHATEFRTTAVVHVITDGMNYWESHLKNYGPY